MEVSIATKEKDQAYVEAALSVDSFHPTTTSDFILPTQPDGTPDVRYVTTCYSDAAGPVLYVRQTKALRIDMVFTDNKDSRRNAEAMLFGWQALVQNARDSGFTEILTSTNSHELMKFGKDVFGFQEVQVDGEIVLRKELCT
jgi:hypothetical protein